MSVQAVEGGGQIIAPKKLGIFLAQFMGPGKDIFSVADQMAAIGYQNVQLPPAFDLEAAAGSRDWCQNELAGPLAERGVKVSNISFHIPGQLLCVNSHFTELYDGFLPPEWSPDRSTEGMWKWGHVETRRIIDTSAHLGLTTAVGFTGAFLWQVALYPWPPRPTGLVDLAFKEMARRWKPLVIRAAEKGVRLCMELHPGEDVHDGLSFERFVDELLTEGVPDDVVRRGLGINFDPSHFVLQALDYLDFIDGYGEWISAYHVKDASLATGSGRGGVYGGFADWPDRAGQFFTPGRGSVDFRAIEEMLPAHVVDRTVEWEDVEQAGAQGAEWAYHYLTTGHLPQEPLKPVVGSFDDFAAAGTGPDLRKLLGI